jgi:choice-of-anchor A domain-containing protein
MISKNSINLGIATIPLAASLFFGFAGTAKAAELGAASGYNVFVLGDVKQQNTDVEGKLAAGGDINYISGGIGNKLNPNSGDVVVAGGDLTLSNSQVYNGNAVYGQNQNVAQNVGIPGGKLLKGNPVDFNAAASQLKQLSTYLSTLAPTGTATIAPWGGIDLTGSGNKLNIFSLLGTDLSNASELLINADADSTVVVNVSGTDISMKDFDTKIKGTTRSKVLYNFFEATSITAESIGIEGSILAPFAAFNFNNGQINGNVVVASLSGNGESHNFLFDGDLPDVPNKSVPEPASIFGLALVAGAAMKKLKK